MLLQSKKILNVELLDIFKLYIINYIFYGFSNWFKVLTLRDETLSQGNGTSIQFKNRKNIIVSFCKKVICFNLFEGMQKIK